MPLLATLILLLPPTPAGAQSSGEDVPVQTATARRQTVPIYAGGIGTVQPYQSVLVRARVDGYLDQIGFTEGQAVKRGDLLAVIDPRPYAAALAQAQAKKAADAAQMANAQADLGRYSTLARSQFASRQQVDTQRASVAQAQANMQGDEAAIQTAALNLEFCRITAPIDGVVGLRLVDIGNLIQASSTQGIVSITQIHPIAVLFTLPQEQLPAVQAALRQGKPPVLAFASDGKTALSSGALLTPNNTIDTSTGTISLKAIFANADDKLWPGQFVEARVQVASRDDAVTVPIPAILHGPGGLFVYVVKPDNTVANQKITVDYQDDRQAVVASGLNGGETVVTNGASRLQNGSRVAAKAAPENS